MNDLNTNIGRAFFVNLLSKNTNNVILLKDAFFSLLGNIIYNILLSILNKAENDTILEELVRLLKSLKFFAKEDKGDINTILKGEKKCMVTLWEVYKQRIQAYPKVNQANLWKKWYKINIANEKEKNDPDVIKKQILELLDIMFDLELEITFIKKTIEGLMKNVLKDNQEKQNEILKTIQKIYADKNKERKSKK